MPKPPCPWCGASASVVYRSQRRAPKLRTTYRRRRRCLECRKTWPTIELLDVEQFARELAEAGLTLEALGLAPAP